MSEPFSSGVRLLGPEEIASILGVCESGDGLAEGIADRTDQRVARQLLKRPDDVANALRFGAFSYLLEGVRASGPETGNSRAVALGQAFLHRNAEAANQSTKDERFPLSSIDFGHFANRIIEGNYDWTSFCIDFLDPEAAFFNRIRQNMELSPTERWHRHEDLRRQIVAIRRAG